MSLPAVTLTTTLRPGLLVGLKTSIKGNVKYNKKDLGTHLEGATERARWEQERTTKDAAEQAAATDVRGRARGLVEAVCSRTEFGLLCPLLAAPDLEKAIAEARALCTAFNVTSKFTKVRFGAVTGKIAQDDLQAARELRREIAELIGDMQGGLEQLDLETVRNAATRAKQLGQLLTPEAATRVQMAVDEARVLARKIAKAGEAGASAIEAGTIARLKETRAAFLDLDPVAEGSTFTPTTIGRGVDLLPQEEKSAAPSAPAALLELF